MEDDIEDLHKSISLLEVQVANMENERNFYAAKASELLSVVKSHEKEDAKNKNKMDDKSQHIAELSMENYRLREQIESFSAEHERLLEEREEDNKIFQAVFRFIQKGSRSKATLNSSHTASLSGSDDEISIADDEDLSKRSVDAKQIKMYISNLEKERHNLKNKYNEQGKKVQLLERKNEELETKIRWLEESEGNEVVQELSRLDALPAPPISDDNNTNESQSDGEYEDEYYGTMYYGYKDVEEDLPSEDPLMIHHNQERSTTKKVRSGSMPLGSPRIISGKEGRRRSESALKGLESRGLDASERSLSSLEGDEQSMETVKTSSKNLGKGSRVSASSKRRASDFSVTSQASQNRSTRSLNTSSLMTAAVLREYDSPGTVKKRAAGSFASPWKSPRFLRRGLMSPKNSNRKASMSPPPPQNGGRKNSSASPPPKGRQASGSPPLKSRKASVSPPRHHASLTPPNRKQRLSGTGIVKSSSSSELMSTQRRAAAQMKIQQQRKSTFAGDNSRSGSSPRSPKRDNNKGHSSIKVAGVKGTYTGPLRDDVPHGVGTVVFVNGDTYIGSVVNGKLHGAGTLYYGNKKDGVDRGIWRNNERIWQ